MRRRILLALAALALLSLVPERTRRPRAAPLPPPPPPPAPVPRGARPDAAATPDRSGVRRAAGVVMGSAREALARNITDVAAALAYYAFLAIPATLLVVVGVFGLFAQRSAIDGLIERLRGVVPQEALTLIDQSLTRVIHNSGNGAGLAVVGLVLAIWTSSGAMSALMRGLNRVHGREETRPFARQRLTALALLGWSLLAVVLSFGLLVLGEPLSAWVGRTLEAEDAVGWIWWSAQWPILIGAMLVAVAGILRVAPAGPRRRRGAVLAGAGVAVVIWLAASGLFSVYVSRFSSYGAAWGSLSAVIVMLVWLWLSAMAILIGGQVEAEVDRRLRAADEAPT